MENFLGWLLIALMVAVPALLVWVGVMLYKRHRKDSTVNTRFQTQTLKGNSIGIQSRGNVRYTKIPTTSTTTSTTTTTSTNDSLLNDLATLYVLNSALQHGSASAKVDYDTGTISTNNSGSSSWGLDDDDSRRSASSSFSSSDSDSSWSSSSDSGPSSDW